MPNHVFSGLDEDTVRTFKEKHDIATKCMKHMSIGETVCGSNCSTYASLLQCIYPTNKVQITTIKSMVLSNCQSASSLSTLPRILYPHPEEQYLYILYYLVEAIELEQARKKYKDESNWSTWLPVLDKSCLNELQQKYFKILSKYNISKKKINRFLTRLNGSIPEKS